LLTALTNMAGAAMPFLKMAAAHPQLALTAIMTFKLAQGISSIAAIGQSAGLARLALQTQSVAVQTERAATQVGRYSGLLRGIPLMLGTTVTLLIAAPVFAYLMKLKEEADQAWQEAKDAAQTGKKADVKLLGALPATPAGVETFLKTQWRGIGYETSALIKENLSTLRQPLGVWPFGDHTKGMKERSEWFGGILKERMPQIEIPALFGEYRRQLNARKDIGPELKQILINASTIAFPKASAEYAEALKNAQGDEYKAIRDLTEASIKAANITREASDKLAESLRSGADAVDDFGRRVRSTRLPGEPEPEPGPVPEGAHARGGLTRRRHVAIIGENPELILPLSQLESVLGGLRGTRGGGGGAPVFHIDARGAQTGVGVEIKRALMEFVRESGLHGLTDDGFRDRALAI
jgi:hypothetical protein